MKNFINDLMLDLGTGAGAVAFVINVFAATASVFMIAVMLFMYQYFNPKEGVLPMSQQNVVCDTGYGVQYFEYRGKLTIRLNHEGTPIRCFEEVE